MADIEQRANAVALPTAFARREPGGVENGMTAVEAVFLICCQLPPGDRVAGIRLYAQPV